MNISKLAQLAVPLCVLAGCTEPKVETSASALAKAHAFDLANAYDSVLVLLRPLHSSGQLTSPYDKLVYFRAEASAGSQERADSLYQGFIAEHQDSLRCDFILEYLNLLVAEKDYHRLVSYSDSLILGCSDHQGRFHDIQMMCYFFRYSAVDDCIGMRKSLDSLKSTALRLEHRMVSDEAIAEYEVEVNAVCGAKPQ